MSDEVKQYTVLVLRPDYIADGSTPVDFFCAWVEARDKKEAAMTAMYEAYLSDGGSDQHDGAEDYLVFAMFEGHLRSLI